MEQALFEKLYAAYYMQVYSYLTALCKNPSLAEELTQETFFKALSAKSGFRQEADEFTWLCAIAKHLLYDEQRKSKRRAELSPELDGGIDLENTVSDKDLSLRIHIALHELKEPYREVFELRVFGELSFAEIGAVFRKTESWARVTYHRARLLLNERIEPK